MHTVILQARVGCARRTGGRQVQQWGELRTRGAIHSFRAQIILEVREGLSVSESTLEKEASSGICSQKKAKITTRIGS